VNSVCSLSPLRGEREQTEFTARAGMA